jgi:hypothetical protein
MCFLEDGVGEAGDAAAAVDEAGYVDPVAGLELLDRPRE